MRFAAPSTLVFFQESVGRVRHNRFSNASGVNDEIVLFPNDPPLPPLMELHVTPDQFTDAEFGSPISMGLGRSIAIPLVAGGAQGREDAATADLYGDGTLSFDSRFPAGMIAFSDEEHVQLNVTSQSGIFIDSFVDAFTIDNAEGDLVVGRERSRLLHSDRVSVRAERPVKVAIGDSSIVVGTGSASSLVVNGEEMVPRLIESIPDIIWGAYLTLLGVFAGLGVNRLFARD